MSRIGKQPVPIPKGLKVTVQDSDLLVEGPKGKLTTVIPAGIRAEVEDGSIVAHRKRDDKQSRSNHGLFRSLVANAVQGVSQGFEKRLDIVGVGYRAEVRGKFLALGLGYSHPILVPIPDGIEIEVERAKKPLPQYVATVSIKGIDKQVVGQMAADIRALRRPNVYKGKGIRYENELVRLKEGKKGA